CGCLCWEFTGQAQNDQFANLNALGYPVEMLGRDALGEYGAGLENLPETALWFPTEGFVEADSATRALLRAAAAKGARVVSGVSVQALTEKGGRITGVKTQVQDMPADQVILAAGVATPALLATLGLDLPMLSRPGLLVHTEPLPFRIDPIIVAEDGQEFRQDASGRIVAPASMSHQSDSAEAITGDPNELAGAALACVGRYLSGACLKVQHITHAMRPVPGDGHPCVGPMGPDGLCVAVLHSGVTLAPLVGAMVAEEISSAVETPELSRYRPTRF
ncbi:MAG: FAD-binding oxidoreductase, partial [Paracoccaceae bacterium]|nr:FAD-binding oxidoreductase [Paracoccaceae bacterium]